jgi:hypothetical protein
MESCRVVLDSVAGGGVALIFDNDAESPFGRRMALRKFLTRYCGLQLVPDYYCNASYPRLERLRQKLQREGGVSTEVVVRDDALKRGLIAMREASTRATAISAP